MLNQSERKYSDATIAFERLQEIDAINAICRSSINKAKTTLDASEVKPTIKILDMLRRRAIIDAIIKIEEAIAIDITDFEKALHKIESFSINGCEYDDAYRLNKGFNYARCLSGERHYTKLKKRELYRYGNSIAIVNREKGEIIELRDIKWRVRKGFEWSNR